MTESEIRAIVREARAFLRADEDERRKADDKATTREAPKGRMLKLLLRPIRK